MDKTFHRHFLHIVFCILMAFSFVVAAEVSTPEQPDMPSLSKIELEVETLNQEMVELNEAIGMTSGAEKDALQLKLFQKNEQLRSVLAGAIQRESISKDTLVAQVKAQQKHSQNAERYLDERIKEINEKINNAKAEERLALINDYQELQHYFDNAIEASWQNIEWLKALDVDERTARAQLRELVAKRLRVMSASVEYFNQQAEVVGKQLSASPESEKSSLQLSQLVLKQRMNIAVDSLSSLVSIAAQLELDTSEYKRLIFETTGNITQDLLETDVMFSILSHWSSSVWDWLGNNAPQHLFQLFVFLIILLATKMIAKLVRKVVSKAVVTKNLKLSQLMQDFFITMSGNLVWIIGILVGLSQIGLNLTPVLTGFGIAGVIIGFALQDTLSNFAAGMMLLIYRPFDVGDFVFAGGVDGKVSHMSLVNTTIKTFDNQIIIVPNSKIWGDVIKNVTHERVRRVDMVFGIGYGDDLLKAESVLTDIVMSHPSVLRTPEPNIRVHTLNTSSVDFIVRPWVKTDDYWDVYWDVTKEVKLRFDREGISIPFPQQDVHLHMVKEDSTPEN